ncbi:alpha/beta fold hydrolase [Sphingosinicella terrae]|uniref:alpha/beta fold hydrolase n=1 Tax=Sphingosinicella terrae TaxID=2172047 RepID=UPI002548A341|nr:alpha/beta fold hydrolase [Sphingosinicella terrae]
MKAGSLELRLIGEVTLLRDGSPCPLPPSRKTRALLAYLAATARPHRREHLCGLFWDVPDDPKGALRWSLSKLRQLLDDDERKRLVADHEHVAIDLEDVELDLARLRTHAEHEDEGSVRLLEERCGEIFCDGLDLPRCEGFERWCAAERENVRQLQITLLRRLADGGDAAARAATLRRLVELDPFDEMARLGLIDALAESGRRGESEEQRQIAVAALEAAAVPVPAGLLRPVAQRGAGPEPPPLVQHIRFCTAPDGTGIAYACIGDGPPLVKTANWLNHIEYEWESPIWRHWLRELTREHSLLRYDERGNGLSDWKVKDLSFEAFVSDLESVVDAAGLDRFDLLGISQGCAVSIAYAVRHPERVKRMVLVGGYTMGWSVRGDPEEIARREAMITLTRTGWGQDNPAFRQMFTTLYFPGATVEQADWFNELQRVSASPEGAQRLQRVLGEIDVRDLVPKVAVPTLVMHSRRDSVVPFSAGRAMAAMIPGARFVGLDSGNHLVLESEPAWPMLLRHLREFLAEPVAGPVPGTTVRTE